MTVGAGMTGRMGAGQSRAMLLASFHTALPLEAGVPEWVHLLPAGTFSGIDGRGPFHLRDAQAVIRASMPDGMKLPIDINHSIDLATPRGDESPAFGWIVELQSRAAAGDAPGGLWGRVEWNTDGTELMAQKKYRGISPVFDRTKDGTVVRLLRASLTNNPNLAGIASLHTTQDTTMDLKALRTALGLAETADEAAILAAVTANATAVTRHTAEIEAIRVAAALPVNLTVAGIATELQTRRTAAGSAEALAAQVQQLSTELATVKAVGAKERAVAFVDGAIKAGKPIVPLRDRYIERHTTDAAGVEAEVNALPSINAGGMVLNAVNPAAGGEGDEPTATEKACAEKMGVDPKALAKQRKEREAKGSAA
jgi:phage I-like protein